MSIKLARLEKYVTKELGGDGEFQVALCTFLCHMTATIADLRDAAMVASSHLHAGNIRDSLMVFHDVVETVCNIEDKRKLLYEMFPDLRYEIDELLKSQDGISY